jgi:hypothetical protein
MMSKMNDTNAEEKEEQVPPTFKCHNEETATM